MCQYMTATLFTSLKIFNIRKMFVKMSLKKKKVNL